MKPCNKWIALLLCIALCLCLLAACASSQQISDTKDNTTSQQPTDSNTQPSADDDADEPTEITMWLMSTGSCSPDGTKLVEQALNELVGPALNIHVNLTVLSMAEYNQNFTLAMTGGDTVDIAQVSPVTVSTLETMYSNGQLTDLAPLLKAEGQDLLNLVGDYLSGYTIGGGIYGIPCYRDFSAKTRLVMREDILEELGMLEFAQNMTTFNEMETLFAAVQENTDLFPIGPGDTNRVLHNSGFLFGAEELTDIEAYSCIDPLFALYVDDTGTVSSLYKNERYLNSVRLLAEWYELGYLYPDTAVTTDDGRVLTQNDVIFSQIKAANADCEMNMEMQTGKPLFVRALSESYTTGSNVKQWGLCVPVTAEEPEAAVRFLNYAYQDPAINDLLTWGVEDVHFVAGDDGMLYYPEGKDASNVGYHNAMWFFGNSFLMRPWEGSGADYAAVHETDMAETTIDPFLGFSADTSALGDQIAALTAVQAEYLNTIQGGLYTEDLYADFLSKLQDAGLDAYLAEYQAQLDAYLANAT